MVEEIYKARILRCPKTGVAVLERYEDEIGLWHRADGPASIERDPSTGLNIRVAFYHHGFCHRSGGEPAVQTFSIDGGAPIWRAWREHGEYARENDLPHVEMLDPKTGNVVRAEYRLRNDTKRGFTLHRENGPAVLTFDRHSGKQTGAVFYRFGRKQISKNHPSLTP